MSEQIHFSSEAGKEQIYEELLPQIHALISDEKNLTANLANISAALKQAFNWWWVGFYWVEDEELVRKLSRQMLEKVGYKVVEAENG